MRRLLLVIAISFMAVAMPVQAQAESLGRLHQNELSLSYGQFSFPQTVYVLGEVLGAAFSLGHFAPQDTRFIGQIGLEYTHWAGRWVGLGVMATTDYMTSVVNGGESPDYTMFVVSALPVLKLSWFNYEHFGMYSKLGAGVSDFLDNQQGHQFIFAFQLSPVCCDFGEAQFRGFVELGYGVQGPCVGIRYIF